MKLKLFDFIDETIALFDSKQATYEYVQGKLKKLYESLFSNQNNSVVSFSSRIKNRDSLKEKMIRNHFYLDFHTPQEALDNLSDLIGITLQCRFIRNETELYQKLFEYFDNHTDGYAVCRTDPEVFLNLNMPQPQTQRNGFTIFRLDGYCIFNHEKIRYELQIKSLVHNFWSDIEHEVVYKNPDFVMYDSFNKAMLGAIRDNLDVVDRQLEIMYNEISHESRQAQIGMDEKGFKAFMARSINELVNRKMKESLGFVTDFKKCSAILAQYIYVHDFVNGEHNQERMIDYFELLNYLSDRPIDFREELSLEKPYHSSDPFCNILGNYWITVYNTDFQWHLFFVMLFEIQPGNNLEDFTDFCEVIRLLLIQPGWYVQTFSSFKKQDGEKTRNLLEQILAQSLVSAGKIDIVHEDRLYDCMQIFHSFVENLENRYPTWDEINQNQKKIASSLRHQIAAVFA